MSLFKVYVKSFEGAYPEWLPLECVFLESLCLVPVSLVKMSDSFCSLS